MSEKEKGPRSDQENAAENVDAKNDRSIRDKMQGSFHGFVRAYIAAGLCLIPIKADGSKSPAVPWKEYQSRKPTAAEIKRWFGPHRGLGIVCGAVSGDLEVIDFDDATLFEPWCDLMREIAPGLLDWLTIHKTPNGYHVIYRCSATTGSIKLASKASTEPGCKEKPTLIETRGEGAQILVPGCAPECHESGRLYVHAAGPPITEVGNITPEERATLFRAARTFDRSEKASDHWRPFEPIEGIDTSSKWELRPGDDFNTRAHWKDILTGWKVLYTKKGVTYWQRPGKTGDGGSATTGHCGELFYVFSSNAAPFDQETAYSKFAAYALLNHQADFTAAAEALADAGYGEKLDEDDDKSEASTDSVAASKLPPAVWPDPEPLPVELPRVMPFNYDLLPDSFRPWIQDIAERVQCPADFPAIAAMIVLATVVGRQIGIRPKRHDDWLVVPNLWGAAIGPPSVMKTPAIQEPLKPLKQLEIEAKKAHEAMVEEYAAEQFVAEQRKVAAKAAVKSALDGSADPMALARDALKGVSKPPPRRRFIVNDSTVEKLGEILNENPNGVLAYRDELTGLLRTLDKEGHEGARAFYLEAWNGTGRYTYDRIGRGTIDIEAAIVSLVGSIQPGPLRSYIRSAILNDEGADGLMQRFQLAVYPDISSKWKRVDRWPDSDARRKAYQVIRSLVDLEPSLIGAQTDQFDQDGIPFLRFDAAAQEAFYEWWESLERRIRNKDEHDAIVAHLAKYRSLVPSLALLLHLADGHTGPVGIKEVSKAIQWVSYLESHARRIFAVAAAPDLIEAYALAGKIVAGDIPKVFALRDIYRNNWVNLSTRDAAQRAVAVLCDLDWLIAVKEATPGRRRQRFHVNPKIGPTLLPGTDKTDKSPNETLLSVLSVTPEPNSPRKTEPMEPADAADAPPLVDDPVPDEGDDWEEVA